jgi:hypothetical protein
MANSDLSMPLAVPPTGADLAVFYATFAGRLTPSWSPATGLTVWVAADASIARLYAPLKAAIRFLPVGTLVAGNPTTTNTLVLQTWPAAYVPVKEALQSAVPSEIRMENVDPVTVRNAVTPLFSAIGRMRAAVDSFMLGNGLLLVESGTPIGAAAAAAGPPAPATPNQVRFIAFDPSGAALNPVQFFSEAAEASGIDKTAHPLLSQLNLHGWADIVALDDSDAPLAGEPYVLYLADGTTRVGSTDASGRIFESGIPAGRWGLDLPNHPGFLKQNS